MRRCNALQPDYQRVGVEWSALCLNDCMNSIAIEIGKGVVAVSSPSTSDAAVISEPSPLQAPLAKPARFSLFSDRRDWLDHFVVVGFVLCVAGIAWLIWDQQRLLQ